MLGEVMDNAEKLNFLMQRGFHNGDMVSFGVENQYSGGWVGPTKGILNLINEEPVIECNHRGNKVNITIQNGYDAYIGSIRKV